MMQIRMIPKWHTRIRLMKSSATYFTVVMPWLLAPWTPRAS